MKKVWKCSYKTGSCGACTVQFKRKADLLHFIGYMINQNPTVVFTVWKGGAA
jgi:hypothetical protein